MLGIFTRDLAQQEEHGSGRAREHRRTKIVRTSDDSRNDESYEHRSRKPCPPPAPGWARLAAPPPANPSARKAAKKGRNRKGFGQGPRCGASDLHGDRRGQEGITCATFDILRQIHGALISSSAHVCFGSILSLQGTKRSVCFFRGGSFLNRLVSKWARF